ncbi:MAG: UDP-N-acetylmuramate dehydrogenase [Bacteroidota bacterium]
MIFIMIIRENISLKAYNTFNIDVKAKRFVQLGEPGDIQQLIREDAFRNDNFLILGGGSNVLFTKDFDGLIIRNAIQGVEVEQEDGDTVIVKAGAGLEWNELVWYCIDRDYGGIENLSLIPGSVGAGPIQNIGAYGVELKDSFHSLEAIEIAGGELRTFNREECQFGYRDSIFKRELKGKYIIVSVSMKLKKSAQPDISYGSIRDEISSMGNDGVPDIRSVGLAVSAIRERKLPDPELIGSAGSFFKNPVVARQSFEKIKERYPDIPSYNVDGSLVKVPAGWLIEQCGWKGKRQGDAGVHIEQALVLVNHGNAGGREILELANMIKSSVDEKFGVVLEMEVNVI